MDIEAVAVTAFVSGLVGAIVSGIVAALKSQGKKAVERSEEEKATDEAVKMGMRALLWRELKNIHEQAVKQNGLAVPDRKHLEGVYAAYHGLGGNGTGTRLYTDAMNKPVLD
ncbi:hypothetical protein [Paratractidigestivibacter sp.]|uniref:hypothetical protein n=1 Tax=Paratractidigestivibacter sp. TaxID=2847316 RepID=UPI002AC9B927|nr:hypothetical protein [Paratractidigestivibacter sp.]